MNANNAQNDTLPNRVELYTYFRSSTSYRVRIALNLKKIPFTFHGIDLKINAHKSEDFLNINPQGFLPVLKDGKVTLCQSLVILEYLEDIYSKPSLYPTGLMLKYKAKEWAQFLTSEMHAMNNLRVLKYLTRELKISEESKTKWYHHFLLEGFTTLETGLSSYATPYAMDIKPTLVDICLIPQIYNALRFKYDMTVHPRLMEIYKHCLEHDAFIAAAPEMQEDCDI
jgi:maleylacetoacetate isomerase